MVTKLATMNPELAALYQEDKNYPIPIKEDCDLEGLFATVPTPISSPDSAPAPTPEQTRPPVPANVDPETGEVLEKHHEVQSQIADILHEARSILAEHDTQTVNDAEADDGRDPKADAVMYHRRRRRA